MQVMIINAAILWLAGGATGALDGNRFLWYDAPAIDWESGALPIGNGRLGATIFGSGNEVITINEDTIWSGPFEDRTPINGHAALSKVREMLIAGNYSDASNLVMKDMYAEQPSERAFSYFGNLELEFGHTNDTKDYVRWLDTREGSSGVSYTYDGTKFTREYIASVPANVLAARFSSDKPGALSLNAQFTRQSDITSNTASTSGGVNELIMSGSSGQPATQNPILFTGKARFVADGAQFTANKNVLIISGATNIEIFFDTETNYRFSTQAAIEDEVDKNINEAVARGYNEIKDEALADSMSLLGRASIDLGKSPDGLADLPTDQRISKARSGFKDTQLATLAWNFGRHLLVASSRNTAAAIDMPANLQGVWNNKTSASWGGKFTININTEMNYWPAGQTNIIETQEPLFDLLKVAKPRGEELAQKMYGCDGIVIHHNLDLWGDPAPTDAWPSSTMWPMGAAWLVQHMMDHYRFTGDAEFLRNTAYPYLVDVANFYHCYTFTWEGSKVTGPSVSAENTFVVPDNATVAGAFIPMDIAPELDNQLMRDVMTSLVEAAAVLGISSSDKDVQAAMDFTALIREPRIGSYGQILEWRYEYNETDPGHRHLSPLYGLHPSHQLSPLVNNTLSKAAKALLDHRLQSGGGSTGWSRTWMINQYARAFSGAEAWEMVAAWFAKYPMANLWNSDSGFNYQIDGNFGATSGLTEMLLQSHTGVVHLLPALPAEAVPTGNARGLLARGGFEIDLDWADGQFKSAVITSKNGGQLNVRVSNGQSFFVDGTEYTSSIQSIKGMRYSITI